MNISSRGLDRLVGAGAAPRRCRFGWHKRQPMHKGGTAPTPLPAKPSILLGHIPTILPSQGCFALCSTMRVSSTAASTLSWLSFLEISSHLSSCSFPLKFLPRSMFWEAKAGLDSSFGLKIANRL